MLALALSGALMACKVKTETPGMPLAPRCYSVEFVAGNVESARNSSGPWQAVKTGDTLEAGQCLRTGHDALAYLKGDIGDRIFLMEMCKVVLDPEFLQAHAGMGGKTRGVEVLSGKAWLDVAKGKGSFIGRTPTGIIRVKGTRFSLRYDSASRSTQVVLKSGAVLVSGTGEAGNDVELKPGQSVQVKPGARPETRAAKPMELQEPERFSPQEAADAIRPDPATRAPTDPPPMDRDFDSVESDLEKTAREDAGRVSPGAEPTAGPATPAGEGEAGTPAMRALQAEKRKRVDAIRKVLEAHGAGKREKSAEEELDQETNP